MTDNFSHKAADWDQPSKIAMTDIFVETMLQKVQLQKHWKALELGCRNRSGRITGDAIGSIIGG